MGKEKKKKAMAAKKHVCGLCKNKYASLRSLLRHVRTSHPDDKPPDLKPDVYSCQYCSKKVSNIWKHIKTCSKRPDLQLRPHQEPQSLPDKDSETTDLTSLSNIEFLERFKERIKSTGLRSGKSTVSSYLSKMRSIIRREELRNPNFRAANWFLHPNDPNFAQLRNANHYRKRHWGSQSVKQMLSSYKILLDWIQSNMADLTATPRSKYSKMGAELKLMMRAAAKGHYNVAAKEEKQEEEDVEKDGRPTEMRVDLALTSRIVESYFKSPARLRSLRNFSNGNYSFPEETGLEPGQADLFIACEIFMRGQGIRMDPVRNLTINDIEFARPAPSQCPHCLEKVNWDEHKDNCRSRASKGADVPPDQDRDQEKKYVMVEVERHKTGKAGSILLVWSKSFHAMVVQFIRRRNLRKMDRPFENSAAYWYKLCKPLKIFVDADLLARTNGNLGPKDFRRYYINRILSKGGDDVIFKLRNIGTSLTIAERSYANAQHKAYLQAEAARGIDRDVEPAAEPSDNDNPDDPQAPVGPPCRTSPPVPPTRSLATRLEIDPDEEVEFSSNTAETKAEAQPDSPHSSVSHGSENRAGSGGDYSSGTERLLNEIVIEETRLHMLEERKSVCDSQYFSGEKNDVNSRDEQEDMEKALLSANQLVDIVSAGCAVDTQSGVSPGSKRPASVAETGLPVAGGKKFKLEPPKRGEDSLGSGPQSHQDNRDEEAANDVEKEDVDQSVRKELFKGDDQEQTDHSDKSAVSSSPSSWSSTGSSEDTSDTSDGCEGFKSSGSATSDNEREFKEVWMRFNEEYEELNYSDPEEPAVEVATTPGPCTDPTEDEPGEGGTG